MLPEFLNNLVLQFKENPTHWVLVAVLLYMLRTILFPSAATSSSATHASTAGHRRAGPATAATASTSSSASATATPAQPKHPETVEFRQFTMRDLLAFNGTVQKAPESSVETPVAKDSSSATTTTAAPAKIYMAVNGKVFDVTKGANFYGPEGPYGNFAGHDASRGLAKGSFEKDMLPNVDGPLDTLADLADDEREALRDWEALFTSKYPQVGVLVEQSAAGAQKDA